MTSLSPRHCPECGATDRLAAERCWMCGAKLREPAGQTQSPFATEATSATFSLSSLFLVMTLVAVGAGVFAAAPGLGVLFLIVATPALVRTMVITSRQKSHGVATTPAEKFVAFLGSTGLSLCQRMDSPRAAIMAFAYRLSMGLPGLAARVCRDLASRSTTYAPI